MNPPLATIPFLLMAYALSEGSGGEGNYDTEVQKSVLENIIESGESDFNLLKPVAKDSIDPAMDALIEKAEQADETSRYSELTDADFKLVAEELQVEEAAIRAVVLIEAGQQMKGFYAPGVPVVNFSAKMFATYKKKGGKPGPKDEKVPSGLTGYGLKEWTQLVNARKQNAEAANLATFWGMFQIGGFNYKRCGCATVDEMVRLMGISELEQLELFAAFITNSGMLDDLKKKDWAAFARKYNGAGYAKRGYHTRMATAYKKFAAEAKTKQSGKK